MLQAIQRAGMSAIHRKVVDGERLSGDDGLALYACPDLNVLGHLANIARERRNADLCYFVRNQHINYTNVCNKLCRFCAFYALPGDPRAYTMSIQDVRAKLRQYRHLPIREVHMVAGINPKLPYQYYLDLVRAVKEERPELHVKAFTMVELVEIARVARKEIAEVLADLKEAGLGSLPGGGAEVFSDRVRQEIFPLKIGRRQWQDIARTAHGMGLRSNATMLYGHLETVEEKVDHLVQLRELQDETGGFLTFIPLAFHPLNTEMDDLPMTTGAQDLRHLALGRLMLDNFPHVKAFWIMISPPVSQVSLWYGADDVDGTIVEEKITHAAGARTVMELTQSELIAMILEAGRIPVERDTVYNVMESWDAERQAMIPALT